jgi:WhiB family redox-sensing transcriptional regulator
MTRRLVLAPEEAHRVSRDPRFQAARASSQHPDSGWRARSACATVEPATFFPDGDRKADQALALCARCAVSGHCLAAALATGEPEGVWGGTTPDERRRMRVVWTDRWRA